MRLPLDSPLWFFFAAFAALAASCSASRFLAAWLAFFLAVFDNGLSATRVVEVAWLPEDSGAFLIFCSCG